VLSRASHFSFTALLMVDVFVRFLGHDSVIHFATLRALPAEPVVQTVLLSGLPMCSLMFLSETALVGVGHDFGPTVYTKKAAGTLSSYSRARSLSFHFPVHFAFTLPLPLSL
jgi:hypothetical protein